MSTAYRLAFGLILCSWLAGCSTTYEIKIPPATASDNAQLRRLADRDVTLTLNDGRTTTGTVDDCTLDSLFLIHTRLDPWEHQRSFPLSSIAYITSYPRSSTGLIVGATVGCLAGAGVVAALNAPGHGAFGVDMRPTGLVAGGLLGGVAGALLGNALGPARETHLFSPHKSSGNSVSPEDRVRALNQVITIVVKDVLITDELVFIMLHNKQTGIPRTSVQIENVPDGFRLSATRQVWRAVGLDLKGIGQ